MKSNFAQNLRLFRRMNGLTQSEISELVGIKRPRIGAYEEGRAEPPLNVLIKIANVLKVTIDKLVR